MPIYERSPVGLTGAEYNSFNEETGESVFIAVQPEDVLGHLARGCTIAEIQKSIQAPREVIEHVIMQIPVMVAWREQQAEQASNVQRLPEVSSVPMGE